MSGRLDAICQAVEQRMDEIVSMFKPGVRITVLVRMPEMPERDFCLSNDDMAEVIAMVERRRAAAIAALPGLTDAEKAEQAENCLCRGTDELCSCQNTPDFTTLRRRRQRGEPS